MRSPVLRFVVTALAVFLSKACENCILDDPGMTGPPSHKKAEELFSACACDSTCDKEMMQEVVDSYFMDPGSREQEFVWNEAKAGWVRCAEAAFESGVALADRMLEGAEASLVA